MNIQIQRIIMLLSWFFVLLWLGVIFTLSSQLAKTSNQLSKSVTREVLTKGERIGVFEPGTSQNAKQLSLLNNRIRKYAHASVYFGLALLVCNALRGSGVRGFKVFVYSLLFCAAYAVSDEIHQMFVPGRGAKVSDFFLDSAGAILGIGVYSLWAGCFLSNSKKPTHQ